ncbi:MAG: NAD(P)H-dependent oxidoreductase [Halopseudomonas yangmingensis]|uniref:NAD(P)H-dependent FMN reductase n=1 Tax=Halopseudomonas yangmingensis TaxID=1720063 RepID=A0A1I4QCG4_9GAMM|nr:NAD(P)H-dependent oxidoreductase [Halopseudomonas yangmingensis]SFM37313.1 NAD(P)H-dependent FMN reductase [Halopseudomonas yangmingensis]
MTHIALVAGSSRPDSQTAKVAYFIRQRLTEHFGLSDEQVGVLDLGSQPLPLWPSDDQPHWAAHREQLVRADAIVILAPEWHGMACPAIKNFFLYAGKDELAHKPALLAGISAGVGGAYPISELRASSFKNCRLCYLPEHLIVRGVNKVMNGTETESEDDQRIRARLDYNLDILLRYADALKPVRAAIDMHNPAFATGM